VKLAARAALALALAAACETRASGAFFAEKLRPTVTEAFGAGAAITCPERIPIRLETVFTCDVERADGSSASIAVTFDRDGMIAWRRN
jgi:hypothetical protein